MSDRIQAIQVFKANRKQSLSPAPVNLFGEDKKTGARVSPLTEEQRAANDFAEHQESHQFKLTRTQLTNEIEINDHIHYKNKRYVIYRIERYETQLNILARRGASAA